MSDALVGTRLWHSIWSLVQKLEASAPEGTVIVVDLETIGGQTYRPGLLQERPPWVVLDDVPRGSEADPGRRQTVFRP